MKRKILSIALATVIVLCCFAGCADTGDLKKPDSEKLSIVCTVFPQYDWIRNILGNTVENTELTLLLDSGTDLHSYQPTAADIIKITSADMFVYVGGASDKWVDDVFNTNSSDTVKFSLIEQLGNSVVEEEAAEGMEAEEEEDHDGETEYDEHVWLSLKNASALCTALKENLQKLDPENSDVYEANCSAYLKELSELNEKYTETVNNASTKTLLFADRFPFRYMTEDLGLDYYGAFTGCSTETEASFNTIVFLADKIDELGLKTILITETSDGAIANKVAETCKSENINILVMGAMQSVTANDVKNGTTYIDTMKTDLLILQQALG